jgi:hypothetical protein
MRDFSVLSQAVRVELDGQYGRDITKIISLRGSKVVHYHYQGPQSRPQPSQRRGCCGPCSVWDEQQPADCCFVGLTVPNSSQASRRALALAVIHRFGGD